MTLLWLGNQRAVEYHPTLALAGDLGHPAHLVPDIDPPSGTVFSLAVRAAGLVREALAGLGLAGAVKTSGPKGVHILVPVHGATAEDAAAATRAIATRAERLDPACSRRCSSASRCRTATDSLSSRLVSASWVSRPPTSHWLAAL
jgi:DNA primase